MRERRRRLWPDTRKSTPMSPPSFGVNAKPAIRSLALSALELHGTHHGCRGNTSPYAMRKEPSATMVALK